MEKLKLGDAVRDTISGFKGVAVARYLYLQGCDRIGVQPEVDKEGKLPESQSFDEPQLEIIRKQKFKRVSVLSNPGGPEKYADKRNY